MNCLSEHGKNVLLLREILKKSACILLTISAFALIAKEGRSSSQNLNINQISGILLENPPVVRESLRGYLESSAIPLSMRFKHSRIFAI